MTYISTKSLVLTIALVSMGTQRVHCWSHPHSRASIHSCDTECHRDVDVATEISASVSPLASTSPSTRRDAFQRASAILLGGTLSLSPLSPLSPPSRANAADTTPSKKDLSRLQRGHARVQYLLQNWAPLTEICGKGIMSDTERKQEIRTQGGGGGACEKTPLRVQDFLGYKSTEDPLFKVDKLMLRAAGLVDPDEFENYLSAVESYREKADQGSMMAYTSSWGEANPNGGKDMIDEYLDKTKDEVVATEKLLRKIMGYLNLEVLPPST